jgi:inner membrane transporter RhtA
MVLGGATSIQFGAAVAAKTFDDLGAAGTSLLRLGFAAVILVALWRPRPREHSAADLRLAALFGLTLGGMNLAFYEALARIPLGIAVTIEFAGPLGVAVALSRRRLDLVWAALAAAGIVLLARPGGGGLDPVGVVFVLVAAACWAAYILINQRAGSVFTGGRGLAMASVVAALVPVAPGIAQGGDALLRPGLLGIGLLVALLSSVIPYSLEVEALRRLPANVFGVLMSLEPGIAALAGYLVLGQDLGARDLVAIALVVIASVGVTRAPGSPPPVEA